MCVMKLAPLLASLALLLPLAPARAHDMERSQPVVIDTDLGLDDAVTLAAALQDADLRISAVVASVGAADAESGPRHLERLLWRFNRGDIRIIAPAPAGEHGVPPFRQFAQAALELALPDDVPARHEPFAPEVYSLEGARPTVLVLGPLTNLAAALELDATVAQRISRIVVAGGPEGWNCQYDLAAVNAVLASGATVEFVSAGDYGHKPPAWRGGALVGEKPTSPGAAFVRDLFAGGETGRHYYERFEHLHDELALVYLLDHDLFRIVQRSPRTILAPVNDAFPAERLARSLQQGRQHKQRVVFTERPIPDELLQADVRARRERILAANGPDEWFSQLQMNELHDHLGAYSIIGVKMGLRAAELLNAPPHSLQVVSYSPSNPPVSCLNDGLIVATGATPGRALFRHEPQTAGPLRAMFVYNGRRITLALKPEYVEQIRARIGQLLAEHTLEDDAYWAGVRVFGLDIWEKWHRSDLFSVVADEQTPATSVSKPQEN